MHIVFDATSLGYWGSFSPVDLVTENKMVGGTEANMMYLAKELAANGDDVIIFRPSEDPKLEIFDGVHYMSQHPFESYITDELNDIDVVLTASTGMRYIFGNPNIKCKLKVDYISCATIHATPEHIANTDIFICLSPWQRDKLIAQGIPEDKLVLQPMGYDSTQYGEVIPYSDRENKIIYTSSPDRGLHHFLEIYKILRERGVDVEADVYYEVDNWINRYKYDMNIQGYRVNQVLKNKNLPGLTFKGATSHSEVIKACQRAKALVYPCDCIEPGETQIISVLEALAAGTVCFLSNHDCIPSLYGAEDSGVLIQKNVSSYDSWANTIERSIIKDENDVCKVWSEQSVKFAEGKDWLYVGERVHNMLNTMTLSREVPVD